MFEFTRRPARALAATVAIAGGLSIIAVPGVANAQGWHGGHHHGGISTGAAVGLGLGAFALGGVLGGAAAYPGYGYGYSYPSYGYAYPSYGYSYPSYGYSYPSYSYYGYGY